MHATFGTTSVHLESENFVDCPCKRHHRSTLVFFPACFSSRGAPVTSTNPLFFQRNSTGVPPAYHLLLKQWLGGSTDGTTTYYDGLGRWMEWAGLFTPN
jgi:hypothetical protein